MMAGNPKPKHGDVVTSQGYYWTYDSAGIWRARLSADRSAPVLKRARWGSRNSDRLWMKWMGQR